LVLAVTAASRQGRAQDGISARVWAWARAAKATAMKVADFILAVVIKGGLGFLKGILRVWFC